MTWHDVKAGAVLLWTVLMVSMALLFTLGCTRASDVSGPVGHRQLTCTDQRVGAPVASTCAR